MSSVAVVTDAHLSLIADDQLEIKKVLLKMNISSVQLSLATSIKRQTAKRWLYSTTAFGPANEKNLLDWFKDKTVQEIQALRSRLHAPAVVGVVEEAVAAGVGSSSSLQGRCQQAHDESLPPPERSQLTKKQVKRVLKRKLN